MTFKKWLKNSKYKNVDPLSVNFLYGNNKNLTDLDGIEEFKNLECLNCSDNNLTSLKGIEYLNNLNSFRCYHNNLTSLKGIENLKKLKELYCGENNLEHKYYYNKNVSIKQYQQYLKAFYRKDKIKNLI